MSPVYIPEFVCKVPGYLSDKLTLRLFSLFSIEGIEKVFPSSISPKPLLYAGYLLFVYAGQVTARKPETKVRNRNLRSWGFARNPPSAENYNQMSRNRLGTHQLDYELFPGYGTVPAHPFANPFVESPLILGHVMVLPVD